MFFFFWGGGGGCGAYQRKVMSRLWLQVDQTPAISESLNKGHPKPFDEAVAWQTAFSLCQEGARAVALCRRTLAPSCEGYGGTDCCFVTSHRTLKRYLCLSESLCSPDFMLHYYSPTARGRLRLRAVPIEPPAGSARQQGSRPLNRWSWGCSVKGHVNADKSNFP